WLPLVLFFTFFWKWMDMIEKKFYLNQGRSTLRIKIPQEIFKSPEAMEFVLGQIHNTANPDNLMQTYLDGKRPLPISLEIVSIGGDVRLYVNTPRRKSKEAFEANMYAQYPGIEIIEEPADYAAEIPLDTDEHDMMAFRMGKKNDQEFPIKTYINYGLDKLPKEEEKSDPITPTLEVLAGIKPYERVYIQIICTAYRKDSFKNGQLVTGKSWSDGVDEKINAIMQRDPKTKAPLQASVPDEENKYEQSPLITPGERSFIEELERHKGKYVYVTGIRWIYITKKGNFNGDLINPVIRTFSQYDGPANQVGVRWRTDFNYKNLFPGGKAKDLAKLKREEFKQYKLRQYIPKGAGDAPKIFSVEELATMFHLPGSVARTPGLSRIPSTRSEAPPNLPIGEM
ncbi:MAG: hypothetical protein WDZ68_02290, partial [Candidatus Paceibacterota bacterium]